MVSPAAADVAIRQSLGLPTGQVAPVPAPAGQQPASQQTPDQALVGELRAQNESLQNQIAQTNANIQALMGEMEVRKRTAEEVKLPSDEELDALPRNEAIKRVAEAKAVEVINQRLMPGLRRMAGDLLETKAFVDEDGLRRAYPGLDVAKYRPLLNEKRASNPGLSALDAIRLIADPAELTPAAAPARSHEAVHMEARGRSGSSVVQQQSGSGPNEADLRQKFVVARQAGNRIQAERYLTEIMKLRPDVPARR